MAGGGAYLALLLSAPILYAFAVATVGDWRINSWHPGVLTLVLVMIAAVVAWVPYRPAQSWTWQAKGWLLLMVALWLYVVAVSALLDDHAHVNELAVFTTLILLYLKRPSREAIRWAVDAMAVVLVATGLAVLVLEVVGAVPSWYVTLAGGLPDLAEYDRSSHWYTLGGVLGLDGRWGGVMRDPNLIGPAAAVLVVYGLRSRGWRWPAFVLPGLLFVVLADSRAAYIALAVGAVLVAALPGWTNAGTGRHRLAAVAVGGLAAARMVIGTMIEPGGVTSMSGRTDMWPQFLALLERSPWTGIGSNAITRAVETGDLPSWANSGHSQFIDTVVRYGVIGLALSTLVLALVLVRAARAAWDGDGLALAMMATFLVAALANLLIDWRYPGALLSMLLAIALLAASTPPRSREPMGGSST